MIVNQPGSYVPKLLKGPWFKCLAGASLLAQILVDKFCDHLPLHRQI